MTPVRALLLAVAVLALLAASVSAAKPAAAAAAAAPAAGASPVPVEAGLALATANPVDPSSVQRSKLKAVPQRYRPASDFMGAFDSVPMNPTKHLQKSLEEDKKYIASILRAPLDIGDPAACTHSDLVRDERELRQIALRINHRRVSLKQQDHWIRSATEGLAKIEGEIASTKETAANLARQLDALEAQKADITAHARRQVLMKEWDNQSSTLMRLKDRRLKEEVAMQKKHNQFALRNHEHNAVLEKLNHMRTQQGLALGTLEDPKPYRFAQVGLDAEAEAEAEAEAAAEEDVAALEVATEAQSEAALAAEAEQSVEAEVQAELDAEAQADAEIDAELDAEMEADVDVDADADAEEEY